MEKYMKYWTIDELLQLTHSELLELQGSISAQITTMPEASSERREALEVLANIRSVLSRPVLAPQLHGWPPPAP